MDVMIRIKDGRESRQTSGRAAKAETPRGFDDIAREFPTVEISAPETLGLSLPAALAAEDWDAPSFDLHAFDGAMDELGAGGSFALRLMAGGPDQARRVAGELLTRCQRLLGRRNDASRSPRFDRLLALHRGLHDLDKPLVLADYRHALDTWQWVLRLDTGAGEAVQIAALFHDIERLISEADRRIEHHARDYDRFKAAHAERGARFTDDCLEKLGVDIPTRSLAMRLVAQHERPAGNAGLALLNDADALSFFSLNSPGFLDYYGEEHTRRKVTYTLRRLRPSARTRLRHVRFRPDVARIVKELSSELAGVRIRK